MRKIEESNPTDFTLLPVFKTGCTPLCISSRKPNHHSHAVSGLGVSLSLYQVTVLRVLHGICTHVAWLVENIKLSRIVCINGLCQARDYFVRTLRQFVDVLRSVAARRVLAISPAWLNAGARVLSRYCTWMVGLLFFIPVVPHTGWTWYRGFPGASWSRLVKRKYTHRVGWV